MIQESARPDAVTPAATILMTDAEFDAFCNELASLAEETKALGLPEGAAQTADEVLANALAQHFRIVLVSPFQGGKSTIFNTVGGGRELSPTGFGLKTSAAIAEARYLEDPNQEEHAQLEWRTDEELLAGMEDLVFPFLSRDLLRPLTGGGKEPSEIRLFDPHDRLRLLKAVRNALQSEEIQERADNADVLAVAGLTLDHYETLVKYRRETRVPLGQATTWLAFPADWTTRRIEDFRSEELVFLFLKKAVFYLREPALRRLRASIIDAPGLQASRWDTAVTTECIRQAHAIVFLLGTQGKSLSQTELRELEGFRRFELAENVFYGYNARTNRNQIRQKLLPTDLAQLQRAGFRVPEDRVSIFNALLAYRTRQFELLNNGRLPEDTIKVLSAKAIDMYSDSGQLPGGGSNHLENARHLITRELKSSYEIFMGREIERLTVELAREAEVESNWEDLIARASRFVIARKGEAILLDRGGRQLVKILERLDGDLGDRAKAAERDAGTVLEDMWQAEAALKVFEQEAYKLQSRVEEELENQGRKELRAELKVRLEKTGPLETAMRRVVDQSSSPRHLPSQLASEATDFVEKAVSGWQAGLTSGTSKALNHIVQEIVKPAEGRLRDLAGEAQAKAPGLLAGGAVVLVSENVKVAYGDIGDIVQAMYPKGSVTDAADTIESFAEDWGFGDVISWFRGFVNRDVLDTVSTWRARVPTTVRAVKSAAMDLADQIVELQIAGIQKSLREEIDKAVREVRVAYEERLRQRQADLAKSFEEKEKISREAAERRRKVGFFRQRVDDFVARASRRLGIAS